MRKIQKYQTTNLAVEENIYVPNYKSTSGISYIKLPNELNYSIKDMINIQIIDDSECLNCF